MAKEPDTSQPEKREPFEKFSDLAKRLATVPKKEVEKRGTAYQKKRARKKGASS